MSDQGQRKTMTADDICGQNDVRRADQKPAVEKPQIQYDPLHASRELQFLNIDNSDLFHTLRRSMATKNFSVPDGDRWPEADLNNHTHLKAIAQLKPDPTEVEPFLHDPGISEWQERTTEYVRRMDDLTADVLDIISATWLKDASHPESMVLVTADDFLRHRGINPKKGGTGRRGGYHNHLRQEIARHIDILQNTWIRVFEREVTVASEGKRGTERRRIKWAGDSRAIIVSSRVGPVTPSGDIEPRAWKIRPGDVFAQFLIGPGRQTALISQMALHYDPYRQYWEKRITRFLAYLWRIRGGRNDYLAPISVEALLQGAGLRVSKRNPKKSRDRMEKGLDQLCQDGVIRSWRYVPQVNEKPASRKGWSKAWVSWKVQIEPPQEIVEYYSKMNHTLSGKKALPAAGK
ncbi:MAG: hypothetical protein M0P73_04710 [Syntrophobacterales bacterium]|nr:hypothetical protein [Syntrophobacterales bacterium]